jgi:hypothetical protein
MSLRTDLVKILANMSDDHAATMERLERYIKGREDDAVKTYILAGRSLDRSPEITPERTEGEQVLSS